MILNEEVEIFEEKEVLAGLEQDLSLLPPANEKEIENLEQTEIPAELDKKNYEEKGESNQENEIEKETIKSETVKYFAQINFKESNSALGIRKLPQYPGITTQDTIYDKTEIEIIT